MMTSALHFLLIKGFPPEFQVSMAVMDTQQLISSSKSICCCPGIRPNLLKVWKNINKSEKNTLSFLFQWGFILGFFSFFVSQAVNLPFTKKQQQCRPKNHFLCNKTVKFNYAPSCLEPKVNPCMNRGHSVQSLHTGAPQASEMLTKVLPLRTWWLSIISSLPFHSRDNDNQQKMAVKVKNIIKAGRERYYSYTSLCHQTQVCAATTSLV